MLNYKYSIWDPLGERWWSGYVSASLSKGRMFVAWGWSNITQPRKITKKLHLLHKHGHNSGSPWWAVQLLCWSFPPWKNCLFALWLIFLVIGSKKDKLKTVRLHIVLMISSVTSNSDFFMIILFLHDNNLSFCLISKF